MAREFVMTVAFDRLWKGLGLTDEDLRCLQNSLIVNPLAGELMQGTNGARKIRFALSNTGKSSGVRVIYTDMTHTQKLYLILCYAKGKQDNLTPEQKKQIKGLIQTLKEV